jgi:hypothetical protein
MAKNHGIDKRGEQKKFRLGLNAALTRLKLRATKWQPKGKRTANCARLMALQHSEDFF